MKTYHTVMLSMVAGASLAGAAIQGLHAQAKPPVYLLEEVTVTDADGYMKDAVPRFQALNKAGNVRALVAGGKVTPIDGEPPKRVVLQVWESAERMHEFRNSPAYKEARAVADKYAKYRVFAVEGLPQ